MLGFQFLSNLDRPDPPRNLRATEVYKDYIVIAWDGPETDGGCPITEYKVEKCDAEKQAFFSAGKYSVHDFQNILHTRSNDSTVRQVSQASFC